MKNKGKDMSVALHKPLRYQLAVRFVGRPCAAELKHLVEKEKEPFAGGDEIEFADIFFKGGEYLLYDCEVLSFFGIVLGYFVHLDPLILGDFVRFGQIVIDRHGYELRLIHFRHLI